MWVRDFKQRFTVIMSSPGLRPQLHPTAPSFAQLPRLPLTCSSHSRHHAPPGFLQPVLWTPASKNARRGRVASRHCAREVRWRRVGRRMVMSNEDIRPQLEFQAVQSSILGMIRVPTRPARTFQSLGGPASRKAAARSAWCARVWPRSTHAAHCFIELLTCMVALA